MCCFAQPVVSVSDTRIFARLVDRYRQAVVYQMKFQSRQPNAMILPLPVRPGSGEQAVSFVSFKDYAFFFDDLDKAFPEFRQDFRVNSRAPAAAFGSAPPLVVHDVGDFIASFVPTMDDFARLDPQFVIPKESWQHIDGYADYGFAVFQLEKRSGKTHPMAFTFQSRWNDRVFFPTVHIHDGKVHDVEDFDHSLYTQYTHDRDPRVYWRKSDRAAEAVCRVGATHGLVNPLRRLYRLRMTGPHENRDVIIPDDTRTLGSNRGRYGRMTALASVATGLSAGLTWLIQRRMKLKEVTSPPRADATS